MPEKRITINLDVPPAVQAGIKEYCRAKGRIQRDVIAQVLTWFITQPAAVKRVVLDDVDGGLEEAYARALEQIAAEVRGSQPRTLGVGFRIDEQNRVTEVHEASGDAKA